MIRFAAAYRKHALPSATILKGCWSQTLQQGNVSQQRWLMQRTNPLSRQTADKQKVSPLGWFLLMIPITTFSLGVWQVKRKAWKEQLIKDLDKQTKIPAVPLPDNLDELAQMEYRLVEVRGKFLHDKEILLGPRSLIRQDKEDTTGGLFSKSDGSNGYLVVTPFKLADRDDIILVNRGWVSRKQTRPESRPLGQINEELNITGVLRKGETRPQFSPEHKGDVFLYRDLPKMCNLTGAVPVFIDATFDSTVTGGPVGGQTRITLRNDHLSYLITWFSLSAATSYMWYRQIIKRVPPI